MREKNTDKAKRIGILYAEQMYKDFWIDHPEFRGEFMTLEKFPDFVSRMAKVSCFSSFSYMTKNMKDLEKICEESARTKALELVKNHEKIQNNQKNKKE